MLKAECIKKNIVIVIVIVIVIAIECNLKRGLQKHYNYITIIISTKSIVYHKEHRQ